jgi:CRP-like cAMP-binding protein
MFFHFRKQFPQLNVYWEKYQPYLERKEVPAKTILLQEGHLSKHYILIEKGCLRAFFNNNGADKTIQFFFEEEGLSSFDSFINNVPGQFTLEAIEASVIHLLPKKYVLELIDALSREPEYVQLLLRMSAQRQTHYINEFVSFIRDTAEQRYLHLLQERPHIVQRVPQHYIASYLGISSVHLSRIKSKLAKGKAHF